MRDSLIEKTYEWALRSSPDALWPILSDSARLNEALGLPLYRVSETFDSNSIRRRYGEMIEDGVRTRWEEPMFEWVENGWWRWRRFYDEGPLRETGGVLMLMPGTAGGTKLNYKLSADPNGTLGRILIASGHLKIAAKSFEGLTRRVDAHCQKPIGDFYSNNAALAAKQKASAAPAKGEPDGLLQAQLASWLAVAPLSDRLDLRSKRLARCLGVSASEALRACLLGVRSGALTLRYRAICPTCRASAIEMPRLIDIPALLACRRCGAGYHRDLAGTVEVLFTATEADAEAGTYCGSGPGSAQHIPVQQNLGALERRDLAFTLDPGVYVARAQDGAVSEMIEIARPSGVQIQVAENSISVALQPEGTVIENHGKRDYTIAIERCEWPEDALPVADLLTEQSFHDLLPQEKLPDGDSAAVGFGIVLAIGDCAQPLSAERAGAVVERDDGYYGLVFTSLREALHSAEALCKAHPDARFAMECGPLMIATHGGALRYIGPVPDTARSLCLAGYRGVIRTGPRVKEALHKAGLPHPEADLTEV